MRRGSLKAQLLSYKKCPLLGERKRKEKNNSGTIKNKRVRLECFRIIMCAKEEFTGNEIYNGN